MSAISSSPVRRRGGGPGGVGRVGHAGRPAADPVERENAKLRKENERLQAELDKARKVIEVQSVPATGVPGSGHVNAVSTGRLTASVWSA